MTSRKAQARRRAKGPVPSETFVWAGKCKGANSMVADILKTVGEAALAEGATEPAIAELCGEQRPQLRIIKGALGPAPKPEIDIEASYMFKALDDGLKAAEEGDINEGARLIAEASRQLKILERTVERVLRTERCDPGVRPFVCPNVPGPIETNCDKAPGLT